MPQTHIYSRADYEAAIANFVDGGQPAPACLRWKLASRRNPGRYDRLEAAWPTMSLEDKISELAMLVGTYIRGGAQDVRHVITYGYEMLCRTGRLA